MNHTRWVALALLCISAGLPGRANACSCMQRSFEEMLDAADLVFVAKVTGAKLEHGTNPALGINEPSDWVSVDFAAVETLKGVVEKGTKLATGLGSCGHTVSPGNRLLVLTRSPTLGLSPLEYCSGSSELGAWPKPEESPRLAAIRAFINHRVSIPDRYAGSDHAPPPPPPPPSKPVSKSECQIEIDKIRDYWIGWGNDKLIQQMDVSRERERYCDDLQEELNSLKTAAAMEAKSPTAPDAR